MKRIFSFIVLLVLCCTFTSQVLAAQYPANNGNRVNDFANIMTADEKRSLEADLANFNGDSSVNVALIVVTVASLDGQTVENYATGIANEWKVGKNGLNNGILFLFAHWC